VAIVPDPYTAGRLALDDFDEPELRAASAGKTQGDLRVLTAELRKGPGRPRICPTRRGPVPDDPLVMTQG
jgi:hypothetical protein